MRHLRRSVATALGAFLLAGGLTGCGAVSDVVGGSSTEDYCDDLESAQTDSADLYGDGSTPPDGAEIEESVQTLRDLGDAAPDEVADDWEVVIDNLDEREAVMEDAGLTYDDLGDGGPEGGLPPEVVEELAALNTTEFNDANNQITAHGESECGLEAPRIPAG